MNPIEGNDFIKKGALDQIIKDLEEAKVKAESFLKGVAAGSKKLEESVKSASVAQAGGRKQIEQAEKQANKLVQANEKYAVSLDKTEKELVQVKAAQAQLNQVNKLTEKLNRSAEGSYNRLSAQYSLNKIKLKALSDSELKTSKAAKALTKDTERLYQRMNTFQKSTGKAQLQVGQYSRGLRGAVAATKSLISAMGLMGGAFIVVSVIRNAINTVANYEQQLVKLSAIMGTSVKDNRDLERVIRDVAKESINTATEIAKTAVSLRTLGKTKNEIKDLLEPVSDLTVALEASADEAGELLVKTLNAFGKGSESAKNFAEVIAAFRISSSLDFEKIKDSLGFLAPTAKTANISFERTGAVLSVLVDNSIKAARAGRLMSSSFLKLAEKGMTLDDALKQLNKTQSETDDELVLLAASSDLFGVQSASLGLILAANIEKLDEYTEGYSNVEGSLEKLKKQNLTSITNQTKLLGAAWEEFILSLEDGQGVMAKLAKSFLSTTAAALKFFSATKEESSLEKAIRSGEDYAKVTGLLGAEIDFASDRLQDAKNKMEAFRAENVKNGKVNIANASEWKNIRDNVDELGIALEGLQIVQNRVEKEETARIKKIADAKAAADLKAKNEDQRLRDKNAANREKDAKELARLALIEQNRIIEQDKSKKRILDKVEKEKKRILDIVSERIEQTHDLSLLEIELLKTTEEEKTRLILEAERKRIKALLKMQSLFGLQMTDLQLKNLETQLAIINDRLNEETSKNKEFRNISDVLGIGITDAQSEQFNFVKQGLLDVMAVREQSANHALEVSNRDLETATNYLEQQQELRDQGEVSDVARAERNLQTEKELNEKAQKQAEKSSKARERIATAETLSSLILASANIFAGFKGAGPLQVVLGAAAVAAMFTSFAAAKITARKSTKKFGGGGTFDISGGSHASGNDTSLGIHGGTEMRVERNEKVGIINSKGMNKYGSKYIDGVIGSLNAQDFESKYMKTFVGADNIPNYMVVSTQNNDEMKQFHREENDRMSKKMNDAVKNIPQPIWDISNGKLRKSIRTGNTTRTDVEQQIYG